MKILMVSSEVVPFAKTGGLADAVPALTATLAKRGHDVRIVMPRYYQIDRDKLIRHPAPMGVPMAHEEMWCGIYESRLPGTQVPVYFLDREDLYGRAGIYGPDGSTSWPDNALRFAFFSVAALQLARYLEWMPDVFHLHDWQAAPVAWLLGAHGAGAPFGSSASVLTIHNLGYQGIFPPQDLHFFPAYTAKALPAMMQKGYANYLASGLSLADGLTTVSPTYAREIMTPEFAEGMGDILKKRANRLTGILNGMDYSDWTPRTDPTLEPHNYDVGSMGGKKQLKKRLQISMGLPEDSKIPLFGMVTRLTEQKGIDLMFNSQGPALEVFRSGQAQLVVLGTGERRFEAAVKSVAAAHPSSCAFRNTYSNSLSRLIESASDFFIMPSRYEPCGLNQMYSLRYGTLPVVRRTGGLADTVIALEKHPWTGNGFVFDDMNEDALAAAVNRAVAFFGRKLALGAARRRGMKRRFDWDSSARVYEKIYAQSIEHRRIKTLKASG